MTRYSSAQGRLDPWAPQYNDDGVEATVCVLEGTTPAEAGSRAKGCVVAILARVFGWSPPLAMALARGVTLVWPGFREV